MYPGALKQFRPGNARMNGLWRFVVEFLIHYYLAIDVDLKAVFACPYIGRLNAGVCPVAGDVF